MIVRLIALSIIPLNALSAAAPPTPAPYQLPAFATPDYACDGIRRVAVQRRPSTVNGGSDVILYDQGGAEYVGDPAGLVEWRAQSTITIAGVLTILPCKAEGGPAPIVIKGDRVKFRVDDARRLVYVDGPGAVTQGTLTKKLTKPVVAGAAPAAAGPDLTVSSDAMLTTNQYFLLFDQIDPGNAGARHVMVLRHSLVEKLRSPGKSIPYDSDAAQTAGILYAARSGLPMDRTALSLAGYDVASRAIVRRFDNASDLLGSITVPAGWNEPIVAVTWQDVPASPPAGGPGVAGQTYVSKNTGGTRTETRSFIGGTVSSNGTGIVEGHGTDLFQSPDGKWFVLTGDVLSAKTANTIVVGGSTLAVTPETRVCAKDGKRISLQDIPVGEKVVAVNARGDTRAQTIRVGVMQSKFSEPGKLERIDTYSCVWGEVE